MHPLPPPARRRGTGDRLLLRTPPAAAASGGAAALNNSNSDGTAADAAAAWGPATVDGQFDDASEDEEQTCSPSTWNLKQPTALQEQQQPKPQQQAQQANHNIISACNPQVNPNNFKNNNRMGKTMVVSPTTPYMPFFFPMMMLPFPYPAVVHRQQHKNQQTRALVPLAPRPTPAQPKKPVKQSTKKRPREKEPQPQQKKKKKKQVQPKSKLPCKRRTNTKIGAAAAADKQHVEKADQKRKEGNAYGTILVDRRIQQKQIDIGESPFYKIIPDHPSDIIVPYSNIDPSKRLAETTVDPDERKQNPILLNDLTSADILLGRGGMSNNHEGNLWFRDLVSHYRTAYHRSAKGQKKLLAQNLCLYVRQSGGRFLEKDDTRYSSAVCFFECGDGRAQAKCAQALREVGSSEERAAFQSRKAAAVAAASSSTSLSQSPEAAAAATNNKSLKVNEQSENSQKDKSCKNIPAAPVPQAQAKGKYRPDRIQSADSSSSTAAARQDNNGTRKSVLTCTAPEPPGDIPGECETEPSLQVLDASGGTKKRKKKRRGTSLLSPGDQWHRQQHHHCPGDQQDGKRLRAATFPKAWSIYDTSSY